jgi:hypothetical protein
LLLACLLLAADFMMNLQMLVWGAKHVRHWGNYQSFVDRSPEQDWMHMAVEHARQVRVIALQCGAVQMCCGAG